MIAFKVLGRCRSEIWIADQILKWPTVSNLILAEHFSPGNFWLFIKDSEMELQSFELR